MKAIILAAGVGKRLNQHRPLPKCLLSFNGRSLLERHLSALIGLNVDDVTLCVGYESSQIATALVGVKHPKVLMLHNPQYRRGSIFSLWTARDTLKSGDDVLIERTFVANLEHDLWCRRQDRFRADLGDSLAAYSPKNVLAASDHEHVVKKPDTSARVNAP